MMQQDDFEDIINEKYPFDLPRPRMSMHERAAQFSPFAALTGYDSLIQETVRNTQE